MRTARVVFVLAAALLGAAAGPVCPPPAADAIGDFSGLTHLSMFLKAGLKPDVKPGLKPGATLEMLAVGSGAANPEAARKAPANPPIETSQTGIPWQTARALEAAVHGLHVNVTVIGRLGQSADDLLAQMRLELRHKPYRLVLWQTGTIEAVDEQPPEDFYQTLADGAAAVTAAGADLVLIDPQYSRFLAANANVAPYLAALKAAAALPDVALFHRFDLMHDWADNGGIDLEDAPKADRPAIRARLHSCLGRELARELLEE